MNLNPIKIAGSLLLVTALLLTTIPASALQGPTDPAPQPAPDSTDDIFHTYMPLTLRVVNPNPSPSSPTIIDHHSVALFERIPVRYLTAAANTRVLFSDRSVGANFNGALDCLAASSFGNAPASCRRHYNANGNVIVYTQDDFNAGRVPPVITFNPNPSLYNRNNWEFVYEQGVWSSLTQNFIQSLAPANMDKHVLSYQFSYLNVGAGSDIMRFWQNNSDRYDIYDLENFMAQHRDKIFIMWTTSLARGVGSQESTDFNNRMRQYARDKNLFLMDFADIEAYTHDGRPCYDNRDGVPFTSPANGNYENYPNDGLNLPAICQDYTTETDGGHLGSVSGGQIRTAKAFWVLMARLAGWNGVSQ